MIILFFFIRNNNLKLILRLNIIATKIDARLISPADDTYFTNLLGRRLLFGGYFYLSTL